MGRTKPQPRWWRRTSSTVAAATMNRACKFHASSRPSFYCSATAAAAVGGLNGPIVM